MRQHELINDDQYLEGATGRFGYAIKTYDDGYGPLWIMRDTMGIVGICRARSEDEAYSIAKDEFFPEADDTVEELEKEYSTIYKSGRELWMHDTGATCADYVQLSPIEKDEICRISGRTVPFDGHFSEHPCFQEAYGFRPNGPRTGDKLKHGIYAKDLNGESLQILTAKMAEDLEITLDIKPYEPSF